MNTTKEHVLAALSQVQEPDLKKDLVTLNMIQDLEVTDNAISFTLMLTTPACPLKEQMKQDCIQAIQKNIGSQYEINIKFDAKQINKIDPASLLPEVKNVLFVSSGKGGVGKSTVAANIALALQRAGASVGLLDADIYGPSQPILFDAEAVRPGITQHEGKNIMLPAQVEGLKLMSIGFLIDGAQAVVWRGPMASSALRQFIADTSWGALDYLVVDLPPGTGDIHMTMAQLAPQASAIVVTTPQSVAVSDARKGAVMFGMDGIKIPVLGIVENMSWFEPMEHPESRYMIFGEGGGAALAQEFETELLAQVPLVLGLNDPGRGGLVRTETHPLFQLFNNLAGSLVRKMSVIQNG
jgi:ATP-binding protein involved in chromosome partitioning